MDRIAAPVFFPMLSYTIPSFSVRSSFDHHRRKTHISRSKIAFCLLGYSFIFSCFILFQKPTLTPPHKWNIPAWKLLYNPCFHSVIMPDSRWQHPWMNIRCFSILLISNSDNRCSIVLLKALFFFFLIPALNFHPIKLSNVLNVQVLKKIISAC